MQWRKQFPSAVPLCVCVTQVATSLLFGRTYSLSWRAPVREAGGSHQALPLARCWHWSGVEGTEIWQPCHKNQPLQTPGREDLPPPPPPLPDVGTREHKVKKSSRSERTHAAPACQRASTWRGLYMWRVMGGGRSRRFGGVEVGAAGRQKHSLKTMGHVKKKPAHTRAQWPLCCPPSCTLAPA